MQKQAWPIIKAVREKYALARERILDSAAALNDLAKACEKSERLLYHVATPPERRKDFSSAFLPLHIGDPEPGTVPPRARADVANMQVLLEARAAAAAAQEAAAKANQSERRQVAAREEARQHQIETDRRLAQEAAKAEAAEPYIVMTTAAAVTRFEGKTLSLTSTSALREAGRTLYVCTECEAVRSSLMGMKSHLNQHENKAYHCAVEECSARFFNKNSYEKHRLAHVHGFKECDVCKSTFQDAKGLASHMDTHWYPNRYTCPLAHCPKPAIRHKGDRGRHVRTYHRGVDALTVVLGVNPLSCLETPAQYHARATGQKE